MKIPEKMLLVITCIWFTTSVGSPENLPDLPEAESGLEPSADPRNEIIQYGEYMFRASGCASCHTDEDNDGEFLAGGRALKTPMGTFYTPNITPHRDDGIGKWSDDDFVRAVTEGIRPDGKHYYPVFPYTTYTHLQRDDVIAIKNYLFSVKPVARKNRTHELPWYLRWRSVVRAWKALYFEPGEFAKQPKRSDLWNRGAYLVRAAGHCAECHTPRGRLGALDQARLFSGTNNGPDDNRVPNITPDKKTGITWKQSDLVYFFQTGATPSGDYTGSLMAEVIDDGLRYMTEDDLKAIVRYLKSLPPVEHAIKDNDEKTKAKGEFD